MKATRKRKLKMTEAQTETVETVEETTNDNTPAEVVESQEEATKEETTETVETETEEVQETLEERLARLEKEREADQRKINRQKKSNSAQLKQIEELLAKQQEAEAQKVEPKVTEPNIDDYDTFEEYQDALAEHKAEQIVQDKLRKVEQEKAQAEQQQRIAERQKKVHELEHKYSELNPTYADAREEFVAFTNTMKLNPQTDDAIIDTAIDAGTLPILVNYFGENGGERLDEFVEIAKLSPVKAGIAIHELGKELSVKSVPEKKKPLPKPAKKIEGASKPRGGLDDLKEGEDVLVALGLK